jgi:hypothetical protein
MTTVLVSVAPSQSTDKLLGTEEPFGNTRTASVDHDAALAAIVHMISMRANIGVKVIELTEEKVVLSYEYDISHMFKAIPADNMEYYGWLYTIEKDPNNKQGGGVHALIETVYALCNIDRSICSREVAAWVAQQANEADHWERENLRAALEYYGTPQAWQEDGKLVSAYNEDILRGQPWRTANDALVNRQVTPMSEAVQKVVDQRKRRNETLPAFFRGRSARV